MACLEEDVGSPVLTLDKVSYWYASEGPEHTVVKDISLTINSGEIVRIAGRNGSGKTTLLKILGGLLSPTRGECKTAKSTTSAIYLDQNAGEFVGSSLTLREQVSMGIEKEGGVWRLVGSKAVAQDVRSVLVGYGLGLEDRLDAFITELSGGQRQIVALLSVLMRKPDLILLDEFTSFMDKASEKQSILMVQNFVEKLGGTAVFVSHSNLEDIGSSRCLTL